MLDLCLALGVPSPRHLKMTLTAGELDLWMRKLAKDRFHRTGLDERFASYQANLLTAIVRVHGGKQSFKPHDFMLTKKGRRRKPLITNGAEAAQIFRAWAWGKGEVYEGDRRVN